MILNYRRKDQAVGLTDGDDAAQAASDMGGALPASATEEAGDEVAPGGSASAAADFSDGHGGLVGDDVRMGAPEVGADGAAEPLDAAAADDDEATPCLWTELHTAINRQDWDLVLRVFSIANHTVKSSVFCGWRRG